MFVNWRFWLMLAASCGMWWIILKAALWTWRAFEAVGGTV